MTAQIRWFQDRGTFITCAESLHEAITRQDALIAQSTSFNGICSACRLPTIFTVNTGAMFANRPNLREGLRCARCKLTARQRLILLALQSETDAMPRHPQGAILEKTSHLYRIIHARLPEVTGSEYLGATRVSGKSYWWSTHWWRWRRTRHESITALSYADQSLSLLIHSDVLEHVYDTKLALQECARVLRKDGVMLFSAPFFATRPASVLRGRLLANGDIEHIESPEYHGDGIAHGGIYTFHNFGWDFFDLLGDSGFSRVEIGLCHSPEEGFTSADPAGDTVSNMLPILFRAIK